MGDVEGVRIGLAGGDRTAPRRSLWHRVFYHGRRLPEWAGLPEDARGVASRLQRYLGNRLLARGPSAGRADTNLSGRSAAGVHRPCRTFSKQEARCSGAIAIRRAANGKTRAKV